MYRAHPTHGAGTWPHRTQLNTAARKTTLNTGQCVRQPREGRGRNRQAPPKKKKKGRGEGEKTRKQPTAAQHPPTPPQAARPPPQEKKKKKKRGTPAEAQGNHPPKTGNTKPVTADHREKGHGRKKKKKKKKKESHQPSPEERGWRDRDHKAQKKKKKRKEETKAQKKKTPPDNPAKTDWAQARPGPSTHAHTARRNRKRRGASGAPTKPHTSQKQAETEAQPRTPQIADSRGTTPQIEPKNTHPKPQPGLTGLTKPAPNRQPDPNTNTTQQ